LGEWNVSFLNGRGQMGRCPPYRNHRTTGCSSLGRRCFPSMTQSSGSILSRLVIGRSWSGRRSAHEKESKTAGRQCHCAC